MRDRNIPRPMEILWSVLQLSPSVGQPVCDQPKIRKAGWLRPFILAPLKRIALRSRQGVHSGIPDGASLPGLLLSFPQHVNLRCSSRDDHVTWGLNPGLTVHLHWSSLEECDTEIGALGDSDSRAQPTLYLALGKTKAELASGTKVYHGAYPPACHCSPCARHLSHPPPPTARRLCVASQTLSHCQSPTGQPLSPSWGC